MDNLQNAEDLLKKACDFQGTSEKARIKARELFRKEESNEQNVFRINLDGLIARLSEILLRKIEKVDDKISYEIGIITSFERSHYLINDLIMTGDLIEATVLCRKQFESLTRLYEIDKKPLARLLKKTPNVINIFKTAGKKLYPDLSEIVHFGTPNVTRLLGINSLSDGKSGPSLVPIFIPESFNVYKSHAFVSTYFAFWFINFLEKHYKNYNSEYDKNTFFNMVNLALKEEIIAIEDDEQSNNNKY